MSSSSPEELATVDMNEILAAVEDEYGGVIVELKNEPLAASLFTDLLHASIAHWKHLGKKGIWIKIPIELVHLVPPAVEKGFIFHHAEPSYLMLVHWLPVTPSTLPANASHRVGIAAFLMNANNQVLVVQEKNGRFRGTGVWKLPTGVVDEGEDICDAAVREVKEETGVDAKFLELLALRQSHKSFFGKSDLFFVCMLEPLSFDIQAQEAEIEAAQWMDFEEYRGQAFMQKHEVLKYISEVCGAKKDGQYTGFEAVPVGADSLGKKTFLYLNKQSLN